jgi:uroporphyrinogen-III synthase
MKILVLRSGGEAEAETESGGDVVVLRTHEIGAKKEGIEEAVAFRADGATLVVSSRLTVRVFLEGKKGDFFRRDFAQAVVAGQETAEAMKAAAAGAATEILVADPPGSPGILSLLRKQRLQGSRILWPRGSDASDEPLRVLRGAGAEVSAPIVYEKVPRSPSSFSSLEVSCLRSFLSGDFFAVAVGSLSALDVLLGLAAARGEPVPQVRWGVLGPETARAFESRGLPRPIVPSRPRLADLIDLLRSEPKP